MGVGKQLQFGFFLLICIGNMSVITADPDKPLIVALTSQFPPYTISREDKTGIDPELISRVLERAGFEAIFIPTNSKRVDSASQEKGIDAVTGWSKEFLPVCHVTKPYRYWLNVLIARQSSDIKSLDDLEGKRLAKFEGAESHINDFAAFTKDVSFMVVSESSIQAGRMIKANRVDAYIGDYVGYYYALLLTYGEQVARDLTSIKHYFNRNDQRICFKDEAIRNKFDKALDELIDEDIYQTVYSKYAPNVNPHHYPDKNR